MSQQIVRGFDPVKGESYTYEKEDGTFTDNEGHGKTQDEADKDFVDTTNIKNATADK